MQQAESEWATLKDLVKERVDGTPVEWRTNDGPGCLQFNYVAATFLDPCRVVFDRRPRGGSGSFFRGDSPISDEEWRLDLSLAESSVVWSIRIVPKLHGHGHFSSEQLAEQIVARLAQYHEDYTKACMPM